MSMYTRLLLIVALLTIAQGNAFALGLGFYGTLQAGEADWDFENITGPDTSYDGGDMTRLGFGFVLDTAVLKDKLFNYRLNVGFERFDADLGSTPITAELVGIAADSSFGFGVLRTEDIRLWVGPRVRVAAYGGDFNNDSSIDIALIEFGVGGVFGANFKVGPTVVLGVETGFMFSGYSGERENAFSADTDFDGDSASLFLNGVVLFRLGSDKR